MHCECVFTPIALYNHTLCSGMKRNITLHLFILQKNNSSVMKNNQFCLLNTNMTFQEWHLSIFAENRREQIANILSVNGCLHVFSIFGNTFSHFREKVVFWVREKGSENSFLHFLNILSANRRECEPYQWFLVNIHSKYSFSPILSEWQ